MDARDRLAAWLVTGPMGHLWSALADIALLWVRYGAHLAQRRLEGSGSRSSSRR